MENIDNEEKLIDIKKGTKKQRKKKVTANIICGLIILAIGVCAYVYRDNINLYNIRKMFGYVDGFFGKGETAKVMELTYDTTDKNKSAYYKGYITVLSNSYLNLYDSEGKNIFSQNVNYTNPNMQCNSKYILTFDRHGRKLAVYNDYNSVFENEYESDIITAKFSSNGNLIVATKKRNYKACITVYNGAFKEVYRVNLADEYVADVDLANDGDTLAIATYNGGTGNITSGISFYDISKEDRQGRIDGISDLILAVDYNVANRLHIVTTTGYYVAKNMEDYDQKLDYSNGYLQFFDIDSDNISLIINKQVIGRNAVLYMFDKAGAQVQNMNIDSEVKSMTVNDDMTIILLSDKAIVYDAQGQLNDKMDVSKNVKKIIVSDSGDMVMFELNRVSIVK